MDCVSGIDFLFLIIQEKLLHKLLYCKLAVCRNENHFVSLKKRCHAHCTSFAALSGNETINSKSFCVFLQLPNSLISNSLLHCLFVCLFSFRCHHQENLLKLGAVFFFISYYCSFLFVLRCKSLLSARDPTCTHLTARCLVPRGR